MKHFASYAVYPTGYIAVGRFTFAGFFNSHIQYLVAANNPAYAGIITESKAIYTSVFANISKYNQDYGLQQAYTKELGNVIQEFNTQVNLFYEAVVFKFHLGTTKYVECFPDGRTGYKRNDLDEIPAKIEQAFKLADKYKADLGADLRNAFESLMTKFADTRSQQKITMGQVKSIIPNYKAQKALIDKQILKNVCTILLENLDNPMAVTSFFDEFMIYPKRKKTGEEPVEEGPYVLGIAAGASEVADLSFSVDDTLIITNTADCELKYYFAASADEAPPTDMATLAIDEEIEIPASTIGAPDKKFLIFVNPSTTIAGEVEIILT